MGAKHLTDDQRKDIQAALLAKVGVNEAARQYKVGKATVSGIAKAMGIDTERSATEKAERAASAYNKERRAQLSNKMFQKVEELLGQIEPTDSLKDLVMAFAILTDKRRLEEGEATDRREYNDPAAIIARGRERADFLRRAS